MVQSCNWRKSLLSQHGSDIANSCKIALEPECYWTPCHCKDYTVVRRIVLLVPKGKISSEVLWGYNHLSVKPTFSVNLDLANCASVWFISQRGALITYTLCLMKPLVQGQCSRIGIAFSWAMTYRARNGNIVYFSAQNTCTSSNYTTQNRWHIVFTFVQYTCGELLCVILCHIINNVIHNVICHVMQFK